MRTLKDLVRAGSLVVAGLALGVSPAWSADVWLDARPLVGTENPAGIPPAVQMWGYASCDPNWTTCVPASVPGPQLVVPANETSLTIHLRNSLPAPTSVVIPGQREDGMGTANSPSDGSGARMRAFTHETLPTTDDVYTWSNLTPGTYLYHSGSHVQVQVAMGLYGGMKHDDGNNRAYPGVNYDNEVMLLFSEVDPILNGEVAMGTYGTPGHPTSAIGYRPQLFLINGVAYVPNITNPIPVLPAGARTLLRLVNAGLRSHVPTLQTGFFHLKAEDGHLLPHGGHEQYSALLAAGKTLDAIWLPTTGIHSLYDRRLNDSMLVKLAVGVAVAQNDAYSNPEDLPLNVGVPGVLGNDGGASPTAQLFSPVTVGTLTLNPNGSFDYTPPAGFNGTATFQYQAVDGGTPSNVATVTITVTGVNDPPVANNDTATGTSGAPIQIAVLANDSDPDGNPLSVSAVSTPTAMGGTVTHNGQTVTYTSALNFVGTDNFTYDVSDGALTSQATVTVTVQANTAPVAVADSATVAEGGTVTVLTGGPTSVLANDTDAETDPLTAVLVSGPTNGSLTLNANGTFSYTHNGSETTSDSFTYKANDGKVDGNTVAVAITVTPVNEAPTAVNDVILVTRYGTFVAPAPGVLANDSDPEGAQLTATLVSGAHATFILGSDGTVTYTPPVEFIGNRTFTYRASDGALTSAAATARLAKLLAVKKAEFTDKAGTANDKWVIEGKASSFAGTSVTIYLGPTPGGTVLATVPIILNAGGTSGNWKYQITGNPVPPDASNMISIQGNAANAPIFTDVPVTLKF